VRIAHLSDIHFGGENVAAVAGAAELLRGDPPDLTVVSGDLTQFGEVKEFEAAAQWLKTLPDPILVTPGNHDSPYIAFVERFFSPFGRFRRLIGQVDGQTHVGKGFVVRGVNTARGVQPRANWSKGQISARQTKAASDWLCSAPDDQLKILVCHHPLTEMIGGPMTGKVWGGAAAAEALSACKVDLVLSGHIHAPFALPYPFGDERTYAAGAGTLSVRERGVPASFNLIEADAQEIRVGALAWKGSHYETYRTWALARRAPA
jgi:3',5'-cyclic AMP phosphodiesterase CpdA